MIKGKIHEWLRYVLYLDPRNLWNGHVVDPRREAESSLLHRSNWSRDPRTWTFKSVQEVVPEDPAIPRYNRRVDGTIPDGQVLKLISNPKALRARAEVRLEAARSDTDRWARENNTNIANQMLKDAEKS